MLVAEKKIAPGVFPHLEFEVKTKKRGNPLLQLVRHEPLVFKSRMSQAEFHEFILQNEELKIERDKHGVITIHPPMTVFSSFHEGKAFRLLGNWADSNSFGIALSPSMLYVLPDGAENKADGSWITMEKFNRLSNTQRNRITPLVPDFVLETRSISDSVNKLKKKMKDVWIANGVRLGWLIDPFNEKAWIYRQDGSCEEVNDFQQVLSGEEVLPGFELKLQALKASYV